MTAHGGNSFVLHHRGTGETLEISQMHVAGGGGGLPGNADAGAMQITSFVRPRRRQQRWQQHHQQQQQQQQRAEQRPQQQRQGKESTLNAALDPTTSSASLEHVDAPRAAGAGAGAATVTATVDSNQAVFQTEQHVGDPLWAEGGQEDEGAGREGLARKNSNEGNPEADDMVMDMDNNVHRRRPRDSREELRRSLETDGWRRKSGAAMKGAQGAGAHPEASAATVAVSSSDSSSSGSSSGSSSSSSSGGSESESEREGGGAAAVTADR